MSRFAHRHRVDELIVSDGSVVGVRGAVLEPTDAARGVASSRNTIGEFEFRAQAVIVASGGIGGNHDLVRQNWPKRMGRVPEQLLSGVPAHVDGRMIGITESAGAHVINSDRMWHYTEGITNYDPIWPDHGIRILPAPSSLWLDATGKRLPAPLYPGFDTLGTLEHIARTGQDYTWFVLNARIIAKEFALSGQEQNPDLTGRSVRDVLARVRPGAPAPVQAFVDKGVDFVSATTLRELVSAMNTVPDVTPLDYATVEAEVTARDREVANRFTKDTQVTAIRAARGYLGDRFTRVVAPHRLTDPKAGPLIAVKLHILTRKSLGGLETDLDSRVLRDDGERVRRDSTRQARPPDSAAAACTATARWRAHSSAAACSPAAPRAGPPRAIPPRRPRPSRESEFGAVLGLEHLEVGVGHLRQPAVVDAAGVGLDDRLVDRDRAGRCDGTQKVNGLRDFHPRRGRRSGEHVHRLAGCEQRVAGMHQPGRVFTVADQIRDVVDHRDLRMDHRVLAADAADGQRADGELVADVHRAPRIAQLLRLSADRRTAQPAGWRPAGRAAARYRRDRDADE